MEGEKSKTIPQSGTENTIITIFKGIVARISRIVNKHIGK